MSAFLVMMYVWLARAPVLVFAAVWLAVYGLRRNGRTAIRAAMDVTFFVLLGSVSELIHLLTGSGWGFWLLVFVLLAAAGFAGRDLERKRGRVEPVLLLKWITRPGFAVLAMLYAVLWLVRLGTGMASG